MKMKLLSIVCSVFLVVNSAKIPSDFKKCNANDKACIKEAIEVAVNKLANGNQELGIPALEPVNIPKLIIGAGKNAVDVEQRYENINIHGYSHLKVNDFIFDIEKGKLFIDFLGQNLTFVAAYELNGRILLLPVQGKGPCRFDLKNVHGTQDFKIEKYNKHNKEFLKCTSSKVTLEPEHVHFEFEKLFNGAKELGDPINQVINDNWKEIFYEVVRGYEEGIAALNMDVANRFFSKIPISELFLKE